MTKAKNRPLEELEPIANEIAAHDGPSMGALIEQLEAHEGLKVTENGRTGKCKVALGGITVEAASGPETALRNWSNEVRRQALRENA